MSRRGHGGKRTKGTQKVENVEAGIEEGRSCCL